jgi:hypothetical protein
MRAKPRGEEGATVVIFDKAEHSEQAMPVEVCVLTIAGIDRPEGLVFHLATRADGRPVVPIFIDEEGLSRIEACLRHARLQYPGCFQWE